MKPLFKSPLLQEELERNGYVTVSLLKEPQIERLLRLYRECIGKEVVSDLYESSRHNGLETNQQINQAIYSELEDSGKEILANCKLYGGTFMVKSCRDSTVLLCHQDWSVVEEDEYQTAFIWCPLTAVNSRNGGVFVLKGSHKYFNNIRSGSYPSNRYVLPYTLHGCVENISLKPGEAIIYYDRVFHGSYPNNSSEDRIVVTGRIVESEAELVYFHKQNENKVDVYPANEAFYLSHIDALAKGQLPSGLVKLYSRPYRDEPVTDETLRSKIRENEPTESAAVKCRLFKDQAVQETFERNGYAVIDLIEQEQVDDLLDFYRGLDHGPMPQYGFQVSLDNAASDFVRRISDKLRQIVEPFVAQQFQDHQIFTASFVVKENNPLGVVPPHQDWTFVDEERYWSASIWCPLVDVDLDNGGLGVIRGSHRFYDHVRPSPSPQYEPPFKNQLFSIFPYLQVIEMKAGQALVFDNRTFHASLPNTAGTSRIAFGLGITHHDAQIQHVYLLPKQERALIERYDIDTKFFFAYNNARLSAMHTKGEKPADLNCTGLFEYTHKDYETPELVKMIEAAGNVRNDELVERMAALFDYNLDGTPKNPPPHEEPNVPENKVPLWKIYTPVNIYKEILFRLEDRRNRAVRN
jgi:ectoine hydroxylase-related dioxygenase (phytanoyl-CoA dioxygenase family)